MTEPFEFTEAEPEAHFVVAGSGAATMAAALFGSLPAPGLLRYLRWPGGGETEAAACWLPPDRLEIRVPLAAAPRLRATLTALTTGVPPFSDRVRSLIARLEAWSYADSDSGSGPAESLASDLRRLGTEAPTPASRRAICQAQEALDDGLPAEVILGTLDRALREIEDPGRAQASGLEPSASG
ncbi:MAG: hypothetical protein M3077_04375 [Candidatus Dormibacteraeota bacterium]|nr:hypothetical protein [Candidatus Dormibacteraeota bacterium]